MPWSLRPEFEQPFRKPLSDKKKKRRNKRKEGKGKEREKKEKKGKMAAVFHCGTYLSKKTHIPKYLNFKFLLY